MAKRLLAFLVVAVLFGLFLPYGHGKSTPIPGIELRDRERYFHRLRFLRMKRPDDPELSYQIGNLYYSLQMEDEAIKEYRRTLRVSPDHSDAKWFLSKVLESKGYYDEAFDLVRELIDLTPQDPELFYRAAKILEKLDQREIALEYYQICDRLMFERRSNRSNYR